MTGIVCRGVELCVKGRRRFEMVTEKSGYGHADHREVGIRPCGS